MKVKIYADGGSRGNPGPAACGVVIFDEQRKVLAEIRKYLGDTTNNQAEYAGLIFGLEKAAELGATEVEIFLDSKLAVEQVLGNWKVKEPSLKPAVLRAQQLLSQFSQKNLKHVRREFNRDADALVNEVLDAKCGPKIKPNIPGVWRPPVG